MKEGLFGDIIISLGFMAIFFGASLLHGVLADKSPQRETYIEVLENRKDAPDAPGPALDHQRNETCPSSR
jgi:hypothetical protein